MTKLAKADIDAEDWEPSLSYPENEVECMQGHRFLSHSKFSGRLVAIVSRNPCPVCRGYMLRASHGVPERQSLTRKDVGDIDG